MCDLSRTVNLTVLESTLGLESELEYFFAGLGLGLGLKGLVLVLNGSGLGLEVSSTNHFSSPHFSLHSSSC